MTTMLEALGTRLATDGVGTLGTTLFLSHMPESPDACVAIYEYGGSVPEMTMGAGLYAINRPRVQVKVRTAREDYPGGATKARAARDSLAGIVNQTLSTVAFARVSPTTSINPLGMDENDRHQFSVNFEVWLL